MWRQWLCSSWSRPVVACRLSINPCRPRPSELCSTSCSSSANMDSRVGSPFTIQRRASGKMIWRKLVFSSYSEQVDTLVSSITVLFSNGTYIYNSHIHKPIKTKTLQDSHFHLENRLLLVLTSWFHIVLEGAPTCKQVYTALARYTAWLVAEGAGSSRSWGKCGQHWSRVARALTFPVILHSSSRNHAPSRDVRSTNCSPALAAAPSITRFLLDNEIIVMFPLITCNISPSFSKTVSFPRSSTFLLIQWVLRREHPVSPFPY